jgi:hypothetical protein
MIRPAVTLEFERLRLIQLEQGYKPGWIYFKLIEAYRLSEAEIGWIAEQLSFSSGWVWHQTASHRAERRESVRWFAKTKSPPRRRIG